MSDKKNTEKQVIARKYLPTRLPLSGTLVWLLVLDRFNAPEWLWGAIGVLLIVAWAVWLHAVGTEKSEHPHDINPDGEYDNG